MKSIDSPCKLSTCFIGLILTLISTPRPLRVHRAHVGWEGRREREREKDRVRERERERKRERERETDRERERQREREREIDR